MSSTLITHIGELATMDPERRTLLQVRVGDTLEADTLFSVLMGDQVEPRRNFITTHALATRNLDV